MSNRSVLRALVVASALVVLGAAPASAHVHVHSDDAAPGEDGTLVFTVPSESDTARTTQVSVALPTGTPFASVAAMPKPGWSVQLRTSGLAEPIVREGFTLTKAVTRVTWTARSGGLAPGEFDQFTVSVGPLPKAGTSLRFDTTQTYSDRSVVRWNQPTPASGKEPDRPAPALTIGRPDGAAEQAGHTTKASVSGTGSSSNGDSTDAVARTAGGIAIVLGVSAVAIALRGRRRSPAQVRESAVK